MPCMPHTLSSPIYGGSGREAVEGGFDTIKKHQRQSSVAAL